MDDLISGKTAKKVANARKVLSPNPKGKLRDQFHEVARFEHRPYARRMLVEDAGCGV